MCFCDELGRVYLFGFEMFYWDQRIRASSGHIIFDNSMNILCIEKCRNKISENVEKFHFNLTIREKCFLCHYTIFLCHTLLVETSSEHAPSLIMCLKWILRF